MSPPRFTPEFKDEAVRQIIERGYSVAEVSARLGVSAHSLYKWVNAVKPDKTDQQASELIAAKSEILRLRAQLHRSEEERDILKKAALDSTGQCNMIQIMLKGIRNDYIAERLDAGTTPTFVADVEDGEQYYGYWNLFEQGTRLGTHLSFTSRRHCATKPPAC